jgi:hypothetical protein
MEVEQRGISSQCVLHAAGNILDQRGGSIPIEFTNLKTDARFCLFTREQDALHDRVVNVLPDDPDNPKRCMLPYEKPCDLMDPYRLISIEVS